MDATGDKCARGDKYCTITYLCAYQILMIAILTKWQPFYKKNEFYFAAVVVVVTWWCFVSFRVRL